MECNLLIPIAMTLRREIRPAGTRYALPGTRKIQNRKLDAVRKREPHVRHVGFIYDGGLTELAHAARLLGAQQVAHAGMPADKFPRRGFLEALGSAAVRLQFHFLVLLHNFLVYPVLTLLSATGTLACALFLLARSKILGNQAC